MDGIWKGLEEQAREIPKFYKVSLVVNTIESSKDKNAFRNPHSKGYI
jgi:hypothetical protein